MAAAPTPVDVEAAITEWLRGNLGSGYWVATETPSTLGDRLPFARLTRVGGADTNVVMDRATVDVDCFAANRIAARQFALTVHRRLRFELPAQPVTGGFVCSVETGSAMAERPWENTAVRRFGGLYQITVKPR